MPRAKILHLIATNFVGGPERQILNHAGRVDSSEFEIYIGSFSEGKPVNPVLEEAHTRSLPAFRIQSTSGFSPAQVLQLRRFLHDQGIQILCTHGYKSNFIGFWATLFSSVPQVAFVRGWTGEDWKVRIYDGLDKFMVRFADLIICVSQAKKKELRNLKVPERKIEVVYNAFDLASLKNNHAGDIRDEFGISRGAKIIASFGRLSPEKAPGDLIRSAAMVLAKRRGVCFLLFGEGKLKPVLDGMIAKFGIEKNVILSGFVKNPLDYMRQVDLVVNPSLTEGLPNVILEALALKKPVVATAVGGVSEIIQDGVTGYLVPPANPRHLAEKILFVLDNPSVSDKAAANGYRILQEKFSAEAQTEKLQNLYRRFLTA